jgi:HEAT repeat protein
MNSGQEPVTAAELLARLEADPEWVRRRDEKACARRQRSEVNRRDAEPLIKALGDAGFNVASVAELYETNSHYEDAVPVLIEWLPRIENPFVKESIARALTLEHADPLRARILVDEFRRANGPKEAALRWAIANALSMAADDSVFDEMVELVEDRRWGKAREMITLGLGNMQDPRAIGVLRNLLADEQVAGHAIMALGRLGASEALPDVEPFAHHSKAWVRHEAEKTIEKIRST